MNLEARLAGSRIVDDAGHPLIVFHGTATNFDSFAGGRGGFYFTDDIEAARAYARHAYGDGDPRVIGAYLNLTNPMLLDRAWFDQNVMYEGEPDWGVVDNTIYEAEELGHDGLILLGFPDYSGSAESGRHEREYNQFVAFRPDQILIAISDMDAQTPQERPRERIR